MHKRSLKTTMLAAAAVCLGAGSAQAVPTTGLYLAMDGSGSLLDSQFTSQINAYVGALNSVFTSNPSLFGQVAIGAGIFGGLNSTAGDVPDFVEVFGVQEIGSAGDLASLTGAIDVLDDDADMDGEQDRAGVDTRGTAIGYAIEQSAMALSAYEAGLNEDLTLLIDVTTDGANNIDPEPEDAAADVTAGAIDSVNCLGIGGGSDCTWVGAAGTDFGSVTFADLEAALTEKIEIETGTVPEPAALALFGLGLTGLGFAARWRKTG